MKDQMMKNDQKEEDRWWNNRTRVEKQEVRKKRGSHKK